jgi:hypothetical protein
LAAVVLGSNRPLRGNRTGRGNGVLRRNRAVFLNHGRPLIALHKQRRNRKTAGQRATSVFIAESGARPRAPCASMETHFGAHARAGALN